MTADTRAMEFKFDNNVVAVDEVLKINNTLTVEGYDKNVGLKNVMRLIIDEMGKASAVAQELKSPITSADELVNSDHNLYVMTQNNMPEHFTVIGILKMGWKNLYLYDTTGLRSESMVYCLMDFYIHNPKQRKGYGKRLLEYMLQDMNLDAKDLAIYKPTNTLLQFMAKHYKLSKLVDQGNNIVVYEDYFGKKNNDTSENGLLGSNQQSQAGFGRHVAHKHHDTMGEILQSHTGTGNFKYNQDSDFVDNKFKEVNTSENDNAVQVNTDQRHRAHKHHDTMGEIIHNSGEADFRKFNYNHDSDFVDKRINKMNSENVNVCQADARGRKGAHKHQDTMGEIVQSGGDFEKFKYNRDSNFVDNRFKEADQNSENECVKLSDVDGHYIKKDIKFHHNPIW
ncbi:Gcn5-related N-acetyltransferase (GNAT) domain, ATAT-type [Cinara cedri]|uniref:Alpha-tubulin N-acetyltransferase n=1 Tax=Cinara cedri TaxID=506608 RepID=A0A5E4N7W3_9HEMI|nr:Gcn5-related N-acetyltransferase (GNAT) domain, ATAT-type [Cinara cedri]